MHEQNKRNSQRRKRKPEQQRPATDHYSHNAAAITMSAMASMASGMM
jgi:hypothetical protein